MSSRVLGIGVGVLTAVMVLRGSLHGQNPTAEPPPPDPSPIETAPLPRGVEVLARGPVHEAFATPTTEPVPTQPVPRQPPKPLEELPPDQKPEGDVVWIGGYWAWDDDKKDYLWVSGIWRTIPPGKTWVPGYWRDTEKQWQWVPGFWTASKEEPSQQMTYLPAPPALPRLAPPAEAPDPDSFNVPGAWVWNGETYVWRAGYWARVQPGYVWVAAHYQWTPYGYVFIPGYWDYGVARRGVLFAPVYVDPHFVTVGFVYTPTYVVRDTLIVDALFVRPSCCHYYFGDYYGPIYRDRGFEACIVYSNRCYDPIYSYARWEHRSEPAWATAQIDICLARHAGQAPCPPRTLVQQNILVQKNITNISSTTTVINRNTVVTNSQVLVPAAQMSTATGMRTVSVNNGARLQMKEQAVAVQQVASQRRQTELAAPSSALTAPRSATLSVPPTLPRSSSMSSTRPSAGFPGASNPAGSSLSSMPAANSNLGSRIMTQPGPGQLRTLSPAGQPFRPGPGMPLHPMQQVHPLPTKPEPGEKQKDHKDRSS